MQDGLRIFNLESRPLNRDQSHGPRVYPGTLNQGLERNRQGFDPATRHKTNRRSYEGLPVCVILPDIGLGHIRPRDWATPTVLLNEGPWWETSRERTRFSNLGRQRSKIIPTTSFDNGKRATEEDTIFYSRACHGTSSRSCTKEKGGASKRRADVGRQRPQVRYGSPLERGREGGGVNL